MKEKIHPNYGKCIVQFSQVASSLLSNAVQFKMRLFDGHKSIVSAEVLYLLI